MSAQARTAPAVASSTAVRLAVIGCLLGVAGTHLLDLEDKIEEAPYLAVMFILLIVASNAMAFVFAVGRRFPSPVWLFTGLGLGLAPLIGYFWSRSIGLPQIADHVGHWADPFGTASVVCEATLVGLCLPSLRADVMRVAPSAIFMAVGLVLAGLMLGQASNSHVGHAGHHHGGAAGAGHTHAGGVGHSHARHVGMNIYTATPAQRAQARRLLAQTSSVAATRFASFDAAKAAGYGFTIKSFDAQKDLDYWHLTQPAYLDDGRDLDPQRPESLMYWHRRSGPPVLVAVVYRIPSSQANPTLGGPVLQWHLHKNAEGGFGHYKMTHLWLVPGMVNAYSMEMPTAALTKRFGTPANGTGTGL